ncbi:MAG: hypothetical protein RL375_3177 [Pseudomonadota bacterium]
MGIKHSTQVVVADNPASPVSRNVWNEEHAVDETGLVIPGATVDPAVPPAGHVQVFARERAGRVMLAQQGPSGIDAWLQPHVGRVNMVSFRPHGTAALTGLGLTLTAVGSASAPTMSPTNQFQETNRIEFLQGTASTTANTSYRSAAARWTRSLTAGRGGFLHIVRFGPATGLTNATRRLAIGLRNATTAPTDVQPSTLMNMIIAGYDSADANFQIMHNDNTGTAVKLDTGIVRPINDRTGIYELIIFAPPGSADVKVYFKDIVNGTEFSATLGTDLPAPGTFLSEFGVASAGGVSSVVGFALFGLYTESDN